MAENKTAVTDLLSGRELRDYLDIFTRRSWWIIITALSVFIVAGIVAWRLPSVYTAETVILVDPQKVPDTYVPATATSSIADRLSTIHQQVVSETRLRKLIESMRLYPERRGGISEQDLVEHMRKAIRIEVVNQAGRQTSAFRIEFEDRNPVIAAQVTNQLASMFIDENLKAREQQSYGTADFLQSELTKTKKELDEKEGALSDLKRRNIGDLPESKQFHLQALEGLRAQLRSSQERVERAHQDKLYLESMLATSAPTIDLDKEDASPYQAQIDKLESSLSQLRSRYGAGHPDVRKQQAELDKLKAQEQESTKSRHQSSQQPAPISRRAHNPIVESQIEQQNEVIQQETKVQADLQPEIAFHMQKLQNIPIFEQEMAGVMRDYETLRTYYVNLLDKKLTADTASALESRQKGERFVTLDPAITPEKPSAPNRPLIAFGGLIVGILAGLFLALGVEFTDESLRSETELNKLTRVPVFTSIPQLWTPKENRHRAMLISATGLAAMVCSVALGWGIALIGSRWMS